MSFIVGFKWYQEGASAPASFTNVNVVQCYIHEFYKSYAADTGGAAFDGTTFNFRRKYLKALVTVNSKTIASARNTIRAILYANKVRISDPRQAGYVAIDFCFTGDSEIIRRVESIATEFVTIELISSAPVPQNTSTGADL